MDDPFVSCPYEEAHRVPRSRLQAHIVKCMKNYPTLHICPYNATHRLPEDQMKIHVRECPAKIGLVPVTYSQNAVVPISKTCSISRKENLPAADPNNEWDD